MNIAWGKIAGLCIPAHFELHFQHCNPIYKRHLELRSNKPSLSVVRQVSSRVASIEHSSLAQLVSESSP